MLKLRIILRRYGQWWRFGNFADGGDATNSYNKCININIILQCNLNNMESA